MQNIPLQALPNQKFSVTLDASLYQITLNSIQGMIYATIVRNAVTIISGVRCVAGMQLIPYAYLESGYGNFAFATPDDENPDYLKFGVTHFLGYASVAELAAYRA